MGATSTRSSSESWARRSASPIDTTPTCSPSGPTRRTSGTRIRSLMRGSVMASPLLLACEESRPVPDAGENEGPGSVSSRGPLAGAHAPGRRVRAATADRWPALAIRGPGRLDGVRWERAPLGSAARRAAGWFACLDVAGEARPGYSVGPPGHSRVIPGGQPGRRAAAAVPAPGPAPRRAAPRSPSTARTARSRVDRLDGEQRDLVVVAQHQRRPRRLPVERAPPAPPPTAARGRGRRCGTGSPVGVGVHPGPAQREHARRRAPGPRPTIATWSDDAEARRRRWTTTCSVSADDGHAPRRRRPRRRAQISRMRRGTAETGAGRSGGVGHASMVQPRRAAGRVRGRGDHRHRPARGLAGEGPAAGRAAARRTSGRSRCRWAARCATSASTRSPSTAAASG